MSPRRPRHHRDGAFVLPVTPTLTVFNCASRGKRIDLRAQLAALREYLDRHFVPVWGLPARLLEGRGFARGAWAIGIFDSEKDADDDGYHDLTPAGLPFARVYLDNMASDGSTLSETLSHELVEMLVDPSANLVAYRSDHVLYDFEIADPVEKSPFRVRGLPMANFVYPAWFEAQRRPRSTRFDHQGRLSRPFQILRSGYAHRLWGGKWRDVWGSHRAALRFHHDARAGARRRMRSRPRRVSHPR